MNFLDIEYLKYKTETKRDVSHGKGQASHPTVSALMPFIVPHTLIQVVSLLFSFTKY